MKKVLKGCAVLAVALMMVAAFSAPCAAEMPIPWLQDLLSWYLQQNGVNITVLLPGSGTGSNTTPGTTMPTIEVIGGCNFHIAITGMDGLDGMLDMSPPPGVYDQHFGILFGAGSNIWYGFQACSLLWGFPGTPFIYQNGQANTSDMFGTITYYSSCEAERLKIIFDFYHSGWRYGGVINNVLVCGQGPLFFIGTYSGARSNFMSPPTRDSYANRGMGSGPGCPAGPQ